MSDAADRANISLLAGSSAAATRIGANARRGQIIRTASDLFCARGFTGVSMRDIAGKLTVSDAALYRYFRSQSEVQSAVMDHGLHLVLEKLDTDLAGAPLDKFLAHFLDATFAAPGFALLWHREANRLSHTDFERLSSRLISYTNLLSSQLFAGSLLSPWHRALRSWWCISAAAAIPLVQNRLSVPAFRKLLTSCLVAATSTSAVEQPVLDRFAARANTADSLLSGRGSRREAIIDSALHLFATAGFQASTMEQIGAHAHVSAAAIYLEFLSKDELLYAVYERGNARLQSELSDVLRATSEPMHALAGVIASYRRLCEDHREYIDVLFRELHLLPEHLSALTRARQREYVAEWVRLTLLIRPELDAQSARIIVGSVLLAIGDLARTPYLVQQPAFAAELDAIALNVLLSAG